MLSLTPPLRFNSVAGREDRKNDVLLCPPAIQSDAPSTVVYFGGDVQDFPEIMKMNMDNICHIKWNLENVATIMNTAFPYSYIVVVRPSRVELKTFSCYDNFVVSNEIGIPTHEPTHYGLHHLEKLLQNTSNIIKSSSDTNLKEIIKKSAQNQSSYMDFDLVKDILGSRDMKVLDNDHEIWWNKNLLDTGEITLIGFSKGCVVLNQFLHELHSLKVGTPDNETSRFVSRITDMFWLDGGHGGSKNTWIISNKIVHAFSSYGIKSHIHVTPYQVRDKRRPWIRKEEEYFFNKLQELGADVSQTVHFKEFERSLEKHFEVLKVFRVNNTVCF